MQDGLCEQRAGEHNRLPGGDNAGPECRTGRTLNFVDLFVRPALVRWLILVERWLAVQAVWQQSRKVGRVGDPILGRKYTRPGDNNDRDNITDSGWRRGDKSKTKLASKVNLPSKMMQAQRSASLLSQTRVSKRRVGGGGDVVVWWCLVVVMWSGKLSRVVKARVVNNESRSAGCFSSSGAGSSAAREQKGVEGRKTPEALAK